MNDSFLKDCDRTRPGPDPTRSRASDLGRTWRTRGNQRDSMGGEEGTEKVTWYTARANLQFVGRGSEG